MSLAVMVALGVANATAATGGPTFSVSYQAMEECPNQATFEAAILARAPRAKKAATDAEAQVRIHAELSEPPRLRVCSVVGFDGLRAKRAPAGGRAAQR